MIAELFGDGQVFVDGQIERLFWARSVAPAVMIAAFVGVVLWTAFVYRRRQGLPNWVRVVLASIRLVVLSLIVAVLFEPTATIAHTHSEKRRVAVLIDTSESMSVKDQRKRSEDVGEAAAALGIIPLTGTPEEAQRRATSIAGKQRQAITAASRLQLVTNLLSGAARPLFESIGEDLDVSYYAFGETLRRLGAGGRGGGEQGADEQGGIDALSALRADQPGTSIAAALETVAKTQRGVPLAGIVLLSDGLDTSARRAEAAVRDLGTRGVPIYTVPVGIVDPDDVSIRGVTMQDVAFTGDKVPIRVQLESKGYEKRTAELTVRLNGRGVARKNVSFAGGVQFEEIFFNVDVAERGAARVEVAIEPFSDEATAANNRMARSVRVVNEKINVLCIEGSARWEFRYLRAMLKRDPRIHATFIATRAQPELAQSSSEYIAEFPEDREAAFAYDLVILGDVDSTFFSAQAFQRLEELVRDRGGSLLMLCGARFAPTSYAGTPVARMLPVEFDADAPWEDVDAGVHPVLTPEGHSSLVMTLEADQRENDLVWSRVAPLDRIPPLRAPRRGATVLAELSDTGSRADRYPLVAWQRYGTGKCMMIATDRLWLLRFKTGDKYHWRVWSQYVQFLTLSRLMGEHKRIRLETDRATYPVDGRVMLYAHLLDDDFEPVTQSGFAVEVSMLDGDAAAPQRVTLRPDAANPGLFEGYFSPPRAGGYRVEANASDRANANSTEFQVADLRPELARTDMQIEHLRRIADLSGGACLGVLDLQKLPGLFDRAPHTTTVRSDRPLWDNWLVASLLVLLLGIEWLLRRKYELAMTDLPQHGLRDGSLDAHLRSVWRRGQLLHGNAGWLAFLRWALLLFLVGMAVDWLVDLPTAGRVVILIALVVVASYEAWRLGWRRLRAFDASRTALQVERAQGGMESLLVTAVQVEGTGSVPGVSASMCEKTRRMAESATETMRPEQTVSFRGLRRGLLLTLIPLLITGGFAIVNGLFLAAGFGRIFAPWLTIEYPTRTRIALADGDRIVKEGAGLRLVANLSGEVPDTAQIILRTGKGKPRKRTLAIAFGVCEYEAETVFRSFEYRITAGDARSAWHTVRVIAAPRVERASVRLEFPEYTRRGTETVEALTLTVPEGTKITWQLALDRAVNEAEFRPVEGTPRALEVSPDGRSVTMEQVAAESRAYSFGWVDKEHGFTFSSPRHYLQVAPDRAPSVELTSPDGMLFATLERRLDFAYRGRDDHGIGAAAITYRVNKTAEKRVALPMPEAPEASDGGEQRIDWDYREALPDLAVGDTVTFAIELADRYPGPGGPHRARSEARRVRFLSKEDYLAQIDKQRRRLLARIRAVYREERGVHDLVRHLDPSADVYIQTCQLEAVRQDLLRERLGAIRDRIGALVDDMAANKVAQEASSAALVALGAELERIGDEHVGRAAALLRELATVDGAESARDPASAIDKVHSSARELGLVVLQLGFAEAADVMARELHATAQTQAALRLRTILGDAVSTEKLLAAQIRLAEETARLLAATPRNQESTSRDALVAFNLSRLVNGLLRSGVDAKMRNAAALAAKRESEAAARIQAEVIAALLHAEFRLRRGAEYEALIRARDLFAAQAAAQRQLREASAARTAADFGANRMAIAGSQATLQRQLRLLLMPAVPAPRPRLFDAVALPAPPVADLLIRAERAMEAALTRIQAGDRAAAAQHQQAAETAFASLTSIVRERIESVTKVPRIEATVTAFAKLAAQRLMLEERLLALVEQTEDAAADKKPTAVLATANQALAEDARGFRRTVTLWNDSLPSPDAGALPLLDSLARAERAIRKATPQLADNKASAATKLQEQALAALEEAGALIEERTRTLTAFAAALAITRDALAPSSLLVEIEAEQNELMAITKKAKPKDRAGLVIPQKNLIHAVNAVLTSLDPLAHKIESGTVMLFAKEDMNAAATGLETGDVEDALDAQSFVVETLQELRAKIDNVTPEYRYVLEVTEYLDEVIPRSAVIRTGFRRLLEKAEGAPDAAALKSQLTEFGRDLQKFTGAPRYAATASRLAAAIASSESEPEIEGALEPLAADTAQLQTLTENFAYLITPPPSGSVVEESSPEVKLIHKALAVAAHHKDLARKTRKATPKQTADLAKNQRKLASQAAALLPKTGARHPKLVAAHQHLSEAATSLESGDRDAAIPGQREAADAMRSFLLEYALNYVAVPPPPPPQDPAPSDDAVPEDGELQLFLPGALTGKRLKGGRLEWQVLGRRDRAALNENFARELPLEYRAILKDYYERLTR